MHVLLLSRYSAMGASSRYRFLQYVPWLQTMGHTVTIAPLLNDAYIQRLYAGKRRSLYSLCWSYVQRIKRLLQVRHYDLVWLEYEALPWMPHWMEACLLTSAVPYVVDYDDAIFHRYDQHARHLLRWLLRTKIDGVMRRAALVTVGNEYLAARAHQAGAARVEIIPTVIDLTKYQRRPAQDPSVFTVGWIGSPSTSQYLHMIQPALAAFCRDSTVRVVAVGAQPMPFGALPFEAKPWCATTEVHELLQFDVGIMPLPDSLWERGKCGFKLIQYMACALPVIGSPVGVNTQIIEHGVNGFHATSTAEWLQAMQRLQQDPALRQCMGAHGRAKVEAHYCLQVTAPKVAQLLAEAKEQRHVRH